MHALRMVQRARHGAPRVALLFLMVAALPVLGCTVQMEGRRASGPGAGSAQEGLATATTDRSRTPATTPGGSATEGTSVSGASVTAGVTAAAGTPVVTSAGQAAAAAALPNGLNAVQVVSAARPSVVHISTSVIRQDQFRRAVPVLAGTGTGVIFDARGYILTNSHVIQDPERGGTARAIRVTLADDRSFDGSVIDDDPTNDLAIVKIDAPNLRPAKIGDSDRLQVGEPVVAIGHALALPGGPTVSTGVVSALGRSIQEPNGVTLPNLVQTDAAINPGNSGGPLLNAGAEVIGINTAGSAQAQGISFAVAINVARQAMESVVQTGRVVRPVLGVQVLGEVTPAIARANGLAAERGVAVSPTPGGPAARAGMREGDIIVAVEGQEVRTSPELLAGIRKRRPGETLRLRIARPGGAVEITATLAEQPT
ncbi:MAG: hypothetical protein AVDCRST_MAG77-3483 [uncultured Chloroflexi bacterium]|uniref:PDZ domain-containing protein n=1 Tax=uncultured Chloroflexota bacterium TaxID=166587 RepID=A0A6J4JG16_9CHLR|nr:MAG: hypothetical protein AVDCRST_MAG77-3483 [uncultured Chloroflexota bacterium]